MASGDTLLIFPAWAGVPTSSNGATFDTRNGHPVADFDDTTDETLIFSGIMPQHYAGTTGVTVVLHATATSATSGNFAWEVAFELDTGLDLDADGFAAVNSTGSTATNGTAGIPTAASVTFTDGADMDSVVAGSQFRLKVVCDAGIASGITGDLELHSLEIRET